MKIIIGSENPTKRTACEKIFPEFETFAKSVSSRVSAQPLSDEETRKGAVNRAKAAAKLEKNHFGIGLEGGVMLVEGIPYLCNWGAFVTPTGEIYTASGARIVLPAEFQTALNKGTELGEIMASYVKKENVSTEEGAVGIFTNDQVDRIEMFTHVVKLLRGQWEYWKK